MTTEAVTTEMPDRQVSAGDEEPDRQVPAGDEEPVLSRFVACARHRAPTHDEPCADCGWLAADHAADPHLAPVIPVPARTAVALRRAS